MERGHGSTTCGRKAALSVFFCVELLAFTACLTSLLSPSWQWVVLEHGRTEHHHGLWLDCKRDYSFDYGRDRVYYETLFRRDMQGTPWDLFFLPALGCVFKFDFYIDPEELYDHDHDENRLWDDAYQHLFLGHKIAATAACVTGVALGGAALILGICSFCHRTFIAACTSLVGLASIMSFVGVGTFAAWAMNQDNAIIKQRDEQETYEQTLGWAFWLQLIGGLLHLVAAVLGCFASSVAFGKGRAKLVRIDVVEGHPSGSAANLLSTSELSSAAPFKRSFSAVYKVDSASLQQWERDYAKKMKRDSEAFVRTKSMPMLTKKGRGSKRAYNKRASFSDHRSSSNLFLSSVEGETTTGTTNTMESSASARRLPNIPTPQPPKLKSALKTPQLERSHPFIPTSSNDRLTANLDSTYEYLPCENPPSSMGVSSFLGVRDSDRGSVYDSVYDQEVEPGLYLEPNSKAQRSTSTINDPARELAPTLQPVSGSSHSIPILRETIIDDVARPSSSQDAFPTRANVPDPQTRTRIRELQTIEELQRIERTRRTRPVVNALPPPVLQQPLQPPAKPSRPVGGVAILPPLPVKKPSPPPPAETTFSSSRAPPTPDPLRKPTLGVRQFAYAPSTSHGYFSPEAESSSPPRELSLNTFGAADTRGSTRSLTSLKFRPGFEGGGSAAEVFERPDSTVEVAPSSSSSTRDLSKQLPPSRPPEMNLHRRLLLNSIPDEVDRSVGSSTVLENDTIRDSNSPLSYARDAELRLNLFLSDALISSSSPPRKTRSPDDSNSETTV